MAYTLTQLAALESALASGERMVQYDGKRVEYRSIAELQAAINTVRAGLVQAGQIVVGTSDRGGTTLAMFTRD